MDDFKPGSKQRKILQNIINEIRQAEIDKDFCGKTHVKHIGYVSKAGELTAIFIVYQYRMISMFYVINLRILVFLRKYSKKKKKIFV